MGQDAPESGMVKARPEFLMLMKPDRQLSLQGADVAPAILLEWVDRSGVSPAGARASGHDSASLPALDLLC
jgi:hypothetical protein